MKRKQNRRYPREAFENDPEFTRKYQRDFLRAVLTQEQYTVAAAEQALGAAMKRGVE